jgi:hypothetical protein
MAEIGYIYRCIDPKLKVKSDEEAYKIISEIVSDNSKSSSIIQDDSNESSAEEASSDESLFDEEKSCSFKKYNVHCRREKRAKNRIQILRVIKIPKSVNKRPKKKNSNLKSVLCRNIGQQLYKCNIQVNNY